MSRNDIFYLYIKTLAKVIGSEEEARRKIYSVCMEKYFAFGALVSEELSNKIKELPGVVMVIPDKTLDEENKDYGVKERDQLGQGCDCEHWLVILEKPDKNMTGDDIIDLYIKTLAKVLGSEEEARMKIYFVCMEQYFAFGALVSEELSNKIKELPGVIYVLPDSRLDEENKDYGGEPFINGQAVPYDPKYHEVWVRNNAERNRRNDRFCQNDTSRNFERSRENMQSRDGMGMQNWSNPGALIKDNSLFLSLSLFIVSQLTIEQAKMRHAS